MGTFSSGSAVHISIFIYLFFLFRKIHGVDQKGAFIIFLNFYFILFFSFTFFCCCCFGGVFRKEREAELQWSDVCLQIEADKRCCQSFCFMSNRRLNECSGEFMGVLCD